MAAIARFISFDGGIAFSASSLKIQKRDEDRGKIIPVAEIVALEVSEPLFGDDGSITVLLNGERLASRENTLYFDDEQYDEAVQFKVAFDTMMEGRHTALPPLDMFQPAAMVSSSNATRRNVQRPPRPHSGVHREHDESIRPVRRRTTKRSKIKKIIIGVVAFYAVLLGVGGIALLFDGDTTESGGGGISTANPIADIEARIPQNDEEEFIKLAKDATIGKTVGDGESITDVSLNGDALTITVDMSDSTAVASETPETIDDFLLWRFDHTAEAILDLGEQYDMLWRTITMDFGEYGKVVNDRFHIEELESGGRYFPGWTSEIVPGSFQANAVDHESISGETLAADVIASSAGSDAQDIGYTSPPVMTSPPAPTDPPVTAAPEQRTEQLVWIPTNGGHKYHSNSGCSNMDGPRQVTVSEATALGFTPCKKCY